MTTMPPVDERARAALDAEWQKRTAHFRGGPTPLAAYLRKDRPESYLFDAALAALTTAISQLDEAQTKLRMVVSHATGGSSQDVDASVNDICVRITANRNHIYEAGKKAGGDEVRAAALEEAARVATRRSALWKLRIQDGTCAQSLYEECDDIAAAILALGNLTATSEGEG